MIPFRSVKFRLTLWYALVLAVLLVVFTFYTHREFSRALFQDTDKNLLREAITLESSMQKDLAEIVRQAHDILKTPGGGAMGWQHPEMLSTMQRILGDWEKNNEHLKRSTLMVRLSAFDRAVIMSNLTGWENEVLYPDYERDALFMETGASFQPIHFERKPIRLYYRMVRHQGWPLFIIQCGKSLREIEDALSRLVMIFLLWIPAAVVAACLAGWVMAKRSFRPVDSMIREANLITAAYLKGRLPRPGTGDELDRLAETLNAMMDRIEISTKAVQDFSVDVSHELKTPLAIIRGEIDLALRRSRTPEVLVETLQVIGGEVNQLIRLVDDLMLLVRSDSKQLQLEKAPVLLKELLQQVAERFQERAHEKKIRLDTETVHPDVIIGGDEVYLKRLVSNLLDNAIKFTPEGGHVRMILSCQAGCAQIEIIDNGIGIDKEIQDKVFARFYRTDQARSYEGTGLGLSIASVICQAHGGTIHIRGNMPQGTAIVARFPLLTD